MAGIHDEVIHYYQTSTLAFICCAGKLQHLFGNWEKVCDFKFFLFLICKNLTDRNLRTCRLVVKYIPTSVVIQMTVDRTMEGLKPWQFWWQRKRKRHAFLGAHVTKLNTAVNTKTWLFFKVPQTCFAALSNPYTLIDQYYRTLSVDTINDCVRWMPRHC